MKFIFGKKLGMTTLYDGEEGALNVTLVECEPNEVSLIRTVEKDGYSAIQLEAVKTAKKIAKKEFRLSEGDAVELKKGDKITVEAFKIGDKVKITGTTKGKGFQGVVKRHGFHGSPASHGHRHDLRAPGSIGSAYPQHVFKGKKMAGRMGGDRFSVKNLKVVLVDKEKNLIGVRGAVPGVSGRMIEIIG